MRAVSAAQRGAALWLAERYRALYYRSNEMRSFAELQYGLAERVCVVWTRCLKRRHVNVHVTVDVM